MNIYPWD